MELREKIYTSPQNCVNFRMLLDLSFTTLIHFSAPSDHGKKAYDAVKKSLKKLDCEYLDLYLIHWPAASGIPMNSDEHTKIRSQSWEGLVKAKKEGLVKDIGVSNYTIKHLKELLANDHGVRPLLNQVIILIIIICKLIYTVNLLGGMAPKVFSTRTSRILQTRKHNIASLFLFGGHWKQRSYVESHCC